MTASMLENSVYLGDLDDKVREFPWASNNYSPNPLQKILQNILVGRTVLITDIHFLLDPVCRNDIAKKSESPLVNLIHAGAIQIPKRENTLRDVIKVQQDAGIESFLRLDEKTLDMFFWLDEEFGNSKLGPRIPSSKKIWSGYYDLMLHMGKRDYHDLGLPYEYISEDDWSDILLRYKLSSSHNKSPSRKDFEKAIDSALSIKSLSCKEKSFAKNKLMNFANEIYHINFSSFLSDDFNTNVFVETSLGSRNIDLFEKTNIEMPAKLTRKIFTINDANYLLDIRNIEKLFSTGSRLGRSRVEFINILNGYYAGTVDISDLMGAGAQYSEYLDKDLVKPKRQRKIRMLLSLCLSGAGAGLGLLTSGPGAAFALAGTIWLADQHIPKTLSGPILGLGRRISNKSKINIQTNTNIPISSPLNRQLISNIYSEQK